MILLFALILMFAMMMDGQKPGVPPNTEQKIGQAGVGCCIALAVVVILIGILKSL